MVTRRYLALDGLRGCAALAVVFYHTPWPTHFSGLGFVRNSYLAVDLFFILSGFVIAANYGSRLHDAGAVRAFLTRRFFRLYPLHLAVLCALVCLETIKWATQGATSSSVPAFTGPNAPALLVENLFMLQGLGMGSRLGWNPPAWSIGAECVAYLLFGWAAFAGEIRRGPKLLCVAAAALLAYAGMAFTMNTLDLTFGFGLLRCLAGFSLGVAIFAYARESEGVAALFAPIAAPLAVAILALGHGASVVTIVPVFVLLVAALRSDRGAVARALSSRPAQFLGRISYSIYLTHMPMLLLATIALKRVARVSVETPAGQSFALSPWTGDLLFAVVLGLVVVLSRATFRLVEEPGCRLGARLFIATDDRRAAGASRSAVSG